MPSANDPRLLAPFKVAGDAVDRERQVRDDNNAPKSDEQIWLAAAAEQNDEISTLEQKYLDELRQRRKGMRDHLRRTGKGNSVLDRNPRFC